MCRAVGHKGHMPLIKFKIVYFYPGPDKKKVNMGGKDAKNIFSRLSGAILPLMRIFLPLIKKNPGHASVNKQKKICMAIT